MAGRPAASFPHLICEEPSRVAPGAGGTTDAILCQMASVSNFEISRSLDWRLSDQHHMS